MKIQQIVDDLRQATHQLGLQVRLETGRFRGGRCTVGNDTLIVLNKRHPPEMHLAVLAESLRELPTETVFLRPAVRDALEAAWRSRPAPADASAFDDA